MADEGYSSSSSSSHQSPLSLHLLFVFLILLMFLGFSCDRSPLSPFIPMPDRDSFHRAGGTPWGLGFALVLLCFMISYHSYFKESWFPLLHRNK
ncbi:hypothetical protein CMV_006097 [Castanea mollissima]|uniref:Transmembrane protein n=1 Tax=Castanea mollissima TaxID=60419 RepID=A0A8J4VRJ8_9ROSI|nr:hypothetical protein CMV_006097 [Castanea mollissima]